MDFQRYKPQFCPKFIGFHHAGWWGIFWVEFGTGSSGYFIRAVLPFLDQPMLDGPCLLHSHTGVQAWTSDPFWLLPKTSITKIKIHLNISNNLGLKIKSLNSQVKEAEETRQDLLCRILHGLSWSLPHRRYVTPGLKTPFYPKAVDRAESLPPVWSIHKAFDVITFGKSD